MVASICAYASEQIFSRQLRDAKLKQVEFDSKFLIEIAKRSFLGRERVSKALPYILSEYGKTINGKFKVNWQDVPSQVILDYVYGIDSTCNFRGWLIAIDITTNPTDVNFKVNKVEKLKPLWSAIGIDYCAVVCIQNEIEQYQSITQLLKEVIKGETFVLLS